MYLNPHEIITKVCKTCGNNFDSQRYFNKEYCTARCRRAAKHSRETERTRTEAAIKGFAQDADARFFAQVNNPTTVQLSKYADLMLEDLTAGKPIQFTGEIPYFQTPHGVVLAEQYGVEPKQWLMMKQDPVASLSPM